MLAKEDRKEMRGHPIYITTSSLLFLLTLVGHDSAEPHRSSLFLLFFRLSCQRLYNSQMQCDRAIAYARERRQEGDAGAAASLLFLLTLVGHDSAEPHRSSLFLLFFLQRERLDEEEVVI
jgi:hypothetical protein